MMGMRCTHLSDSSLVLGMIYVGKTWTTSENLGSGQCIKGVEGYTAAALLNQPPEGKENKFKLNGTRA